MQSLKAILNSAKSNPSPLILWCNRTFEFVSVGYAPEIRAMQIACFDDDSKCQKVIWYQYDIDTNEWSYEFLTGSKIKRIEIE
jgi:hypothetical protein